MRPKVVVASTFGRFKGVIAALSLMLNPSRHPAELFTVTDTALIAKNSRRPSFS